jgi:DNA-binding winged helix-turn-helix (wHTH) protein
VEGPSSAETFLFEGFRFDRAEGCLFRLDGPGIAEPVTLGSRALALLNLLSERQGKLVSKDEIMKVVWPGMAVEEGNLTVQISALRRILDRDREQGSCIQTVSGRGYRFVAPVTRVEALTTAPISTFVDRGDGSGTAEGQSEPSPSVAGIDGSSPAARPAANRLGRTVLATVAGALCLVAAVVAAVTWRSLSPADEGSAPRLSIAARNHNEEVAAGDAEHPKDPLDALDYILRGQAALGKWPILDHYAAAIGWFERALALSPQSVEARNWLAGALALRVLRRQSDAPSADLARADELVEQALTASPRSTRAHYVKGQVLRAQHRCSQAVPEYEAVVASDPDFRFAYANLAWCKFLTGSPEEEVISRQEQAIRLAPDDHFAADFYLRIGLVHLLKSQIAKAIDAFEKARNGYPSEIAELHACLAAAYALKGETERATAELDEARRLSNDNRFESINRLKATQPPPGEKKVRALFETTYFAGLRRAGMPEE